MYLNVFYMHLRAGPPAQRPTTPCPSSAASYYLPSSKAHHSMPTISGIILPERRSPSSKAHHSMPTISMPDSSSFSIGPHSSRLSLLQPEAGHKTF